MEFSEDTNHTGPDKETLYIFGGASLILFGAGLIISSPIIRRYLGQFGTGSLVESALADLGRYLKLRAM